jgi:hypothetical protein
MKDEGAVAHTWQLLIAAFLTTADWGRFRRERGPLALQGGALILAPAPVAILHL